MNFDAERRNCIDGMEKAVDMMGVAMQTLEQTVDEMKKENTYTSAIERDYLKRKNEFEFAKKMLEELQK